MDSSKAPISPSYNYEAEKLKLLGKIQPVVGVVDTDKLDENARRILDNHIAQFNAIMDLEDHKKQKNSFVCRDPLDALPQELWEEIILSCFIPDTDEPIEWSLDQLIDLTCVSSRWRKVIIETPSFWRTIPVCRNVEDLEIKIALCLHLSGTLPLDVVIDMPTIGWDRLGPLIASQSHRIRSIFLHDADSNFSLDYPGHYPHGWGQKEVNAMTQVFTRLPALEDFICYLDFDPVVDLILRTANCLLEVHNVSISEHTLGLRSFNNLKNLSTSTPYADIIHILPTLTSLREVMFYEDDTEIVNAEHPSAFSLLPPQSWIYFCMNQPTTLSLDPLYTSISQTLKSLDIRLNWSEFSPLILACSQMANLQWLRLEFNSEDTTSLSQLLAPNLLPQLLSLVVAEIPTENDGYLPRSHASNIRQLFESLTVAAINVQDLDVKIYEFEQQATLYAESLIQLKNFNYILLNGVPASVKSTILPKVEVVGLPLSDAFISSVQCPQALGLLGTEIQFEQSNPHLQYNHWNNLRVIEVGAGKMTWQNISLPHVEQIILTRDQILHEPDATGSPLFAELAQNPNAFPSLNDLALPMFPEWDIFFLMLEKRNFLLDQRVKPITTVAFPRLPAQIVLRPLVMRLRQRLSTRLSNYELSLIAHVKEYFDAYIPGCRLCHRGFLPCNMTSTKRHEWTKSHTVDDLDEKMPRYPEDTDEILTSWRVRAQFWEELDNHLKFTRLFQCKERLNEPLVEITGYTLSS